MLTTEWCQVYDARNTAFVLNTLDQEDRVMALSKLNAVQSALNRNRTDEWLAMRSTTLMCFFGQGWRRKKQPDYGKLLLGVEELELKVLAAQLASSTLDYAIEYMDKVARATCLPWRWLMNGTAGSIRGLTTLVGAIRRQL
jgi:hypothetical protein